MPSISNNGLLFHFIFVNKHRIFACDSLLIIETSKQEGNSWQGKRFEAFKVWDFFGGLFGRRMEGLKLLFSTPFFFFFKGSVMKVVFFQLVFLLMLNALFFFPILVTS